MVVLKKMSFLFLLLIGIIHPFHTLATESTRRVNASLKKALPQRIWDKPTFTQKIQSSSVTIKNIWTEDKRPEKVIIAWKHGQDSKERKCKILKLKTTYQSDVPISRIISTKLYGPDFEYEDTDVEINATYRYRVWMEVGKKQWIVSKEVFTVPQPILERWWDFHDSTHHQYYVNGLADTVLADANSIRCAVPIAWEANFLRCRAKLGANEQIYPWESLEEPYIVINLPQQFREQHGEVCHYTIQVKDSKGNLSRWSQEKEAILDSRVLEVESLEVNSKINDEATDGWMEVKWNEPDDLSGIASYSIYQKIGNATVWDTIDTNFRNTIYKDLFNEIDTSTTIHYKIGTTDKVGNERQVDEIETIGSARCLLGPTIELKADVVINERKYVRTDSVIIQCNKYDITDLVGFNVQRNSSFVRINTNAIPFKVHLPQDNVLYTIKVQAIFLKNSSNELKTTWSNEDNVFAAFIPPRPALKSWGDWENPNTHVFYVDGKADKVCVDPESLPNPESSPWEADSLQFRMQLEDIIEANPWQPGNIHCSKFNLSSIYNLEDYNGKICRYSVQFKDSNDNYSQESKIEEVILDITPPGEVEWLNAKSETNENGTDWWIDITWGRAVDTLSGLSSYSIYRKIGDGDFDSLKQNLYSTVYEDSSIDTSLDGGTKIYYKIGSVDHVGNERTEAEIDTLDSTLCLNAPRISIVPDTVLIENEKYIKTESAKINFSECDTTYLIGFEVEANGDIQLVTNNANSFTVDLPEDTVYQIRARALFGFKNDILKSVWSNFDNVHREASPPVCVSYLKVNHDSIRWGEQDCEPWQGNMYLRWQVPCSNDADSCIIHRKRCGDNEFKPVGYSSAENDTITWVDRGDSNEYDGTKNDSILAFEYYTYKVTTCNLFKMWHSKSCTCCTIDTAYGNRAPTIISVEPLGDPNDCNTVCITWKLPPLDTTKYPMNRIRSRIKIYQGQYIEECLIDTIPADGVTKKCINLNRSYKHYFEVCCLTQTNKGDTLYTAWSLPDSIGSNIVIPPVKHVELQPQPTLTEIPRIFVCWDSCWKDTTWENPNIDNTLVDSFVVKRYRDSSSVWVGDTSFTFLKNSEEWTYACFMDSINLSDHVRYQYEVIPYQTTEAGPGCPEDNEPGEVLCETGRVYIPKIDLSDTTLFFTNPDTNEKCQCMKFFFDGMDDKINVKWCWENGNQKGATKVSVQISDNPDFEKDFSQFVRERVVTLSDSDWAKQEVIFDSLSQKPYFVGPKDPVYLRVTACDKWCPPHTCHPFWSTDWDDIEKVYNDATPPDATHLKDFCVKAVASSDSYKVVASFEWEPPSFDYESGLKCYHVVREGLKPGFIEDSTASKDTLAFSYVINLKELETSTDFQYKLEPEDWVGHRSSTKWIWKALKTPGSFKVEYLTSNPNKVYASWECVDEADGYYIEWCADSSKLGCDTLRSRNSAFHDTTSLCEITISEPGIAKKFFFHALAFDGSDFYSNCNESGWTEVRKAVIKEQTFLMKLNISDKRAEIPLEYSLGPNYPNPFNSTTQIIIGLPEAIHVSIKIFNMMGMEVICLLNEIKQAGYHSICWDGKNNTNINVASGIYLLVFETRDFCKVQKCILLR